MIIGYLSFGRVPGCLGLGALFLWDEWRDERTDSRPAGSLSVLFFGGVRCGGLPGGGGPSALRWMAAGAEFPCGVPGGEGHRRCGGCNGMRFWRFLSKGFC